MDWGGDQWGIRCHPSHPWITGTVDGTILSRETATTTTTTATHKEIRKRASTNQIKSNRIKSWNEERKGKQNKPFGGSRGLDKGRSWADDRGARLCDVRSEVDHICTRTRRRVSKEKECETRCFGETAEKEEKDKPSRRGERGVRK